MRFPVELALAALLAGAAPVAAFYALKNLFHREVDLERFKAGKPVVKLEPKKEKKRPSSDLPAARAALLVLALAVAAGGTAFAVTGLWQAALVASAAGFAAPKLWLSWQAGGREKLLSRQLEEVCEKMAAVLRSGGGLPAALELALRDAAEPLKSHLAQAVAELRLGVSTAEVFDNFAAAVKTKEFELVASAVRLQQEGMAVNMAVVFDSVQEALRENRAFAEEVAAVTAENRLSAWIVSALPFVVVGAIRGLAPDFIAPLFNTTLGLAVFAAATAMIVAGIYWINNMVNIRP